MSKWINWDHKCTTCGETHTEMHERVAVEDTVLCLECHTHTAERVLGGYISTSKTSASSVDGVGNKFGKIKRGLKLKKELAYAKASGDRDAQKIARHEISRNNKSSS